MDDKRVSIERTPRSVVEVGAPPYELRVRDGNHTEVIHLSEKELRILLKACRDTVALLYEGRP